MSDFVTACLKADEATVIAILTNPPYSHIHVQTYDGVTGGDLLLDVYTPGGVPQRVGGVADPGDKVFIHTRKP